MITISDRAAVEDQAHRLEGPELRREIAAVAAALQSIGVGPGDRVLLLGRKSVELAVALLAVPEAGAIAVAPFQGLTAAQFRHLVEDADPAVTIAFDSCPDAAAAALAGRRVIEPDQLDRSAPAPRRPRTRPDDPALIIYTSGSSGPPKGVVFSRRNLALGAASVAEFYGLTAADQVLCLLPLCFDAGLNQLLAALHAGATAHLRDFVLPHHVAEVCEERQITVLTGVPPLWRRLVEARWPAPARESLRLWGSTGGTVPAALSEAVCELFPRARPVLMYGFTEAFRATHLPEAEFASRPTSIGVPIPHASIALIDAAGRVCGPGEPGEIVQFGPLVTEGYWRRPAESLAKFASLGAIARAELLVPKSHPFSIVPAHLARTAWSGDSGWIDDEGFLYFESRRSGLIKAQGFRISPTEVEEACRATGRLVDVVAFGVERDGEEVVAVAAVPDSPDLTAEQLRGLLRRTLPAYQVPQVVAFVARLQLTANGKYDLPAVRQEVSQAVGGRT